MLEEAGFVFRKGSKIGTAPVLADHIRAFSESKAREWAGKNAARQEIVDRLIELRASGKPPSSDFWDRVLSIDHKFARAKGGPEFNPFYLQFMIGRDNSVKGTR
jgi:hypothetical protein